MRTVIPRILVCALASAVLVSIGCRSNVERTTAPATVTRSGRTVTASNSGVNFSPEQARVGDRIDIKSSGWPDGEISLYLIPDDEGDIHEVQRLRESGGLFAVARARVVNGEFAISLRIPSELVSENGQRTRAVTPGRYQVGAQAPNELRSSGYLNITE